VLESNGIIAPQGQVQNFSVQTAPKSSGDERVKELMGAFAAVAIERARVFKLHSLKFRKLQTKSA